MKKLPNDMPPRTREITEVGTHPGHPPHLPMVCGGPRPRGKTHQDRTCLAVAPLVYNCSFLPPTIDQQGSSWRQPVTKPLVERIDSCRDSKSGTTFSIQVRLVFRVWSIHSTNANNYVILCLSKKTPNTGISLTSRISELVCFPTKAGVF